MVTETDKPTLPLRTAEAANAAPKPKEGGAGEEKGEKKTTPPTLADRLKFSTEEREALPEEERAALTEVETVLEAGNEAVRTELTEAQNAAAVQATIETNLASQNQAVVTYYDNWAAQQFGTEEQQAAFKTEMAKAGAQDRFNRGPVTKQALSQTAARTEAWTELFEAAHKELAAADLGHVVPSVHDAAAYASMQADVAKYEGKGGFHRHIYELGVKAGASGATETALAEAKAEGKREALADVGLQGRPDGASAASETGKQAVGDPTAGMSYREMMAYGISEFNKKGEHKQLANAADTGP